MYSTYKNHMKGKGIKIMSTIGHFFVLQTNRATSAGDFEIVSYFLSIVIILLYCRILKFISVIKEEKEGGRERVERERK